MSRPEIRFGECETGSRCDVAVTLTNGHPSLPVTYKAAKVAQFKVWPASGRLVPMQVCSSPARPPARPPARLSCPALHAAPLMPAAVPLSLSPLDSGRG